MKSFGIFALGFAAAASAWSNQTTSASSSWSKSAPVGTGVTTSPVAYTTEVVTALTTVCPSPTTLTVNSKTYTVTSATTLTITDCPCTVSKPVTTPAPMPTPANMAPQQNATTTVITTDKVTVPCPAPTTLTTGGQTFTVKSATTITVSNCKACQVTKTLLPATTTVMTTDYVEVPCPTPTTITTNGKTYPVTSATTLTLSGSQCPCKVTSTITPSVSAGTTYVPSGTGSIPMPVSPMGNGSVSTPSPSTPAQQVGNGAAQLAGAGSGAALVAALAFFL